MNYEDWSKTAKTLRTLEVNRDVTRDIYLTPNGTYLCHDVGMPASIFRKQWERVFISNNIPITPQCIAEIAEFKGTLDGERGYVDEGYSWGWFSGEDSLKNAYNYAEKYLNKVM